MLTTLKQIQAQIHQDGPVESVIKLSLGNTKQYSVTHVIHGFTQTAKVYQTTYTTS